MDQRKDTAYESMYTNLQDRSTNSSEIRIVVVLPKKLEIRWMPHLSIIKTYDL